MPDAVSVGVAKAVTAALAAATLSQEFTPERSYADWDLELSDSDCLHVDVATVINKQACFLLARGKKRFRIPVDIAVRKRFGTDKQDDDTGRVLVEQIDALCLLVEEIHSLFLKGDLNGFDSAQWEQTEIIASPATPLLAKLRQFVGIVRVTFLVDVAVA